MLKFNFDDRIQDKSWISFYPAFNNDGFSFKIYKCWYGDARPTIVTSITSILAIISLFALFFTHWAAIGIPLFFFTWGELFINLPFDSGKYQESELEGYGITFTSGSGSFPSQFIIYMGKKTKLIYAPWYRSVYKNSVLLKDNSWLESNRKNPKDFYNENWQDKIKKQEYFYKYILKNGSIQYTKALVHREKAERRPHYTHFLPFFSKTNEYINVTFNPAIGEGVNSFKGGTSGCSYEMKPGEILFDTLMRMEKERKFN